MNALTSTAAAALLLSSLAACGPVEPAEASPVATPAPEPTATPVTPTEPAPEPAAPAKPALETFDLAEHQL